MTKGQQRRSLHVVIAEASEYAQVVSTRVLSAVVLVGAVILAGEAFAQSPVTSTRPGETASTSLPYEVLAPPDAAKLKNLPVVIYLHPSAQPNLTRAQGDYWPMLRERKCLMVLPRGKSERMWLTGEDRAVLNVLAEVQTRYSVDERRVILWGVSGGGQFALFLASRFPEKFRAVVVLSTNPVAVRGEKLDWFYPARSTLKVCPWFVANPITQGSALMYWRQVRAKLAPEGASISIVPLLGQVDDFPSVPKELGAWLDDVLGGRFPAPLPDPQQEAVKRLLAPTLEQMVSGMDKTVVAANGQAASADGASWRLGLKLPTGFERSKAQDRVDSTGAPLTQIRIESQKWPIFVRAEVRSTEKPMSEVLSAEETETLLRGMLYQVYHAGQVSAGERTWTYKIGSITYPDRKRGWVTSLFLHAAAPVAQDPRQWLTIQVTDETQQPDAAELVTVFKSVLSSVTVAPGQAAPSTAPKE